MAYEQKPGQGVLFKNDRKEKDTHPDYKGSININGVEHWLSAWIKDGAKGKFMSLAVGEPKNKPQQARHESYGGNPNLPPPPTDLDDEIPF
jgi:hypothetical protein